MVTMRPRPTVRPRACAELAELLGIAPPAAVSVELTGITLDSRAVQPGDLYAALPGAHTHGARFAADAVAAGAAAILTDPAGADVVARAGIGGIPVLVVPDPRSRLGQAAAWTYGYPARQLQLVGITGTNGKTTTSYLLDAAIRGGGRRSGLIGTVATQIGDVTLPSARTTPEAPDLQALLAVMLEGGAQAVTMEVSSHALALGRVDGVVFDLAVFTNFSQDHLDFHRSLDEYFATKASLFTPERARTAAVCTDEEWGRRLANSTTLPCTTFGLSGEPHWRATDVRVLPAGGSSFTVVRPSAPPIAAAVALPGEFNVANALAALVAAAHLGLDPVAAATAIAECPGVPGRMEPIRVGQEFLALVDYAHSPDAVTRALAAARANTSGRVIAVLGAGGDRDREKRSLMGAAAAAGADLIIVTDDNPRSEPPAEIRAAVLSGARAKGGEAREEPDRAAAIALAVATARPGDCVLVLGKGHEQGQEVAGVVTPFDDRVELRRAIASQEEHT